MHTSKTSIKVSYKVQETRLHQHTSHLHFSSPNVHTLKLVFFSEEIFVLLLLFRFGLFIIIVIRIIKGIIITGQHKFRGFLSASIHSELFSLRAYFKVLQQKVPYFNVSRQKIPYFNVLRQKVPYFNISSQKYRTLTFFNKTETYLTGVELNLCYPA